MLPQCVDGGWEGESGLLLLLAHEYVLMERYVVKAGLDYQEPLVEVRLRSQELAVLVEAFLIIERTLLMVLIIMVFIAERAFCAASYS